MLLQLNSVIVDADVTNRQEMAGFLGNYGVSVVAQFGDTDQLAAAMARIGALHLVIVNLDPTVAMVSSKPCTAALSAGHSRGLVIFQLSPLRTISIALPSG